MTAKTTITTTGTTSGKDRLRVLLFASYAELLGARSLDLNLPAGSTVADLVAALRQAPGGERLPQSLLVAVNERYATGAQVLNAGDEIAIIPPVAGG